VTVLLVYLVIGISTGVKRVQRLLARLVIRRYAFDFASDPILLLLPLNLMRLARDACPMTYRSDVKHLTNGPVG
jgi:hypothetical protein